MKTRIKVVTRGDGRILYYPQAKKNFWVWEYFYDGWDYKVWRLSEQSALEYLLSAVKTHQANKIVDVSHIKGV